MEARYTLMSIVAGGVLLGAVASQAVPSSPLAVQEPGWRGMIQDQYRMAYTPAARGGGPEDSTGAALVMAAYDPDAAPGAYTLPPEYAEAERFARQEARAAIEAERRFRLAYAEATRPLAEVTVTRGSTPDTGAIAAADSEIPSDSVDVAAPAGEAKVVSVAAAPTNES